MEEVRITSRNNPRIKELLQLQKRRGRERAGLFYMEGSQEVERAVKAGYRLETVFYCDELTDAQRAAELADRGRAQRLISVNRAVYERIAVRGGSGGLVVTAHPETHRLEGLSTVGRPLFLVIEGVEKPGNIGAVYRTADAAGLDGVIICNPRADLYNANAIRASLGCVFTVPTAIASTADAINWLKQNKIAIYSTHLDASVPYHTVDFTGPSAIVAGTEATGLTSPWTEASSANIIIPMRGEADSLNISVSAAVVVFEAVRQREMKGREAL